MAGSFLAVRVRPLSNEGALNVDGIAISPVALFLWEDRATAHFVSAGADTADHGKALERWAQSGRLDDPPQHPFVGAFSQLEIALVLADGTEASAVGTSVGGSDSEWEAAAQFRFTRGGAEGPVVVRIDRRGAAPLKISFEP